MGSRPALAPLTSLRFFAAAAIVVHHLRSEGLVGIDLAIPLGQGVSFFFVLSGFILAYNYPSLERNRDKLRFLVARVARIWPLHVACLAIGFALIPHYSSQLASPEGPVFLLANVLLVHSWLPIYDVAFSYSTVSWSISVEMFFYVLFPLLATLDKRGLVLAYMIAAILIVALLTAGSGLPFPELDYWTQPGFSFEALLHITAVSRMVEFLTGIVAARLFLAYRNRVKLSAMAWTSLEVAVVACVVLMAVVFRSDVSSFFRSLGGAQAVSWAHRSGLFLFYGAAILIFARSEGLLSKILSLRSFVYLGEISFAVYMIHAIVLTVFRALEWGQAAPHGIVVAVALSCIGCSAVILHHTVERPAREAIMRYWDQRMSFGRVAYRLPAVLGAGIFLTAFAVALLASPLGGPASRAGAEPIRTLFSGDLSTLMATSGNSVDPGPEGTALIRSAVTTPTAGGMTGGVAVLVPSVVEVEHAGQTIVITVVARGSGELGITYSTAGEGNSGWFRVDLTDTFKPYRIIYTVEARSGEPNGNYVGLWAPNGAEIRSVWAEVISLLPVEHR